MPFKNATVVVNGSELGYVTDVYVDLDNNGQLNASTDPRCTITSQSDTQLTCTVPQITTGTYRLFLFNPGNQVLSNVAVTFR